MTRFRSEETMRLTIKSPILPTLAVGLLLAGCAPVLSTIDTPKEGQVITLAQKQPMRVRWANLHPDSGAWTLEQPPKGAVTTDGVDIKPPAAGAQQLESFKFVGVKAGEETLTFAYKRKDGAPPSADERVTVKVKVS
jgi:hypothetical protein